MIKLKQQTCWTGVRHCIVGLSQGRWAYNFCATTHGDIMDIGGTVATYAGKFDPDIIANWVTSGIVPDAFETHCQEWFSNETTSAGMNPASLRINTDEKSV